MVSSRGRSSRTPLRLLAALGAMTLMVNACGGDDDAGEPAGSVAPVVTGASTTDEPSGETVPPTTSNSDVAQTTTPGPTTGEAPSGSEPEAGGTATYLSYTELGGNFDPVRLVVNTAVILDGTAGSLVYSALVATNPETREVEPVLAESLSSDDGTVWTLVLREGVVFSDGTEFDAEAVKFNWERHADEANTSSARGVAAAMTAIDVVDERTLQVTLREPNMQFPRTLGQYSLTFIASPTAIQAGTIGEKPVGAGPFLLQEWVRDDHMTFIRNDTYWDAPRPYLDEVIVKPILDPTQRNNAMMTGQGDVTFATKPADVAALVDAGLVKYELKLNGGQSLLFNFDTPLGGDARFRTALRLAIDNEQISELVHQGFATDHATTWFTPESPFYDESAEFAEPDLEEAQRLIDEVAAENGGTVAFSIVAGLPNREIANALQAQLSPLDNLDVQLDVIDTGAHIQKVNVQRDYVVTLGNSFNLDPEPRTHDFFLTGSPRNYTNYSDPDMDAALKAGRAAATLEDREAAYQTVQQLIIDQNAMIVVSRADHYIVYNADRLQDLSYMEDGVIRWDRVWVTD
jgi:peptide/nickel transport system substrate-binding protein